MNTPNLELYQMDHCPYCQKVRAAFDDMNIKYKKIDALPGTPEREELISLGGKGQVPFLVDKTNPDNLTMMYESDDIVAYVQEHYSA